MRKSLRFAGVFAIVAACWFVVDAILTADRAERCLHACIIVIDVVEQYVRITGRWPSSWDELRQTVPSATYGGIHEWPDDITVIREFVAVDFDADPGLLAESTPESFNALRPIGPCYSSYDRHFEFLIEALRETRTP